VEKKHNLLIIIILVLFVCVLGLSGYIVYDNVLQHDEETEDESYYGDCKGCDPSSVPVSDLNPIGEIEHKLGIKVPVLYEKLDNYIIYNEGWPYYAFVSFDSDSSLEIAKDFKELSIPKSEFSSVSSKLVNSIEVTLYEDSIEDINSKAAVWQYDKIYYAFELSGNSSLDFERCVEELIEQIVY